MEISSTTAARTEVSVLLAFNVATTEQSESFIRASLFWSLPGHLYSNTGGCETIAKYGFRTGSLGPVW